MAAERPSGDIVVTVARILRPHGVRGEVAAEILTDFPERLSQLTSVKLSDGKAASKTVAVKSCWLSKSRGGQAIFHFEGSNSMSDAEKLVGHEVQIPFSDRMPLPGGSYYVSDLIGCEVHEKPQKNIQEELREKAATLIGRVRDVQFAGTPLLVVDSAQGELLIPLAQDICVHVDTAARRIEVVLPDGLRELNQP